MSPWLRALVFALLLPAYCLAAIGVDATGIRQLQAQDAPSSDAAEAGQETGPEPGPEAARDAGPAAGLLAELGDTSDDAAELPTGMSTTAAAAPPAAGRLAAPDARAPENLPDRLLRPPRRALHD